MKFSANLGFLWAEFPLPEAIHAARAAGFEAVECHWPYDVPAEETARALEETGLILLGLNTLRGNPGENGLSALPGREGEARAAIDQALAYAGTAGAGAVHVMAGFAQGAAAHASFVANLTYAAGKAASMGKTILIEPLNKYDAPGYFLQTTDQAIGLIEEIGAPNLKLMFDCYHVQLMEGDICNRLTALQHHIGHIQFAGVPARGRPDESELDYGFVLRHIASLGHTAPLGAEYKPGGRAEDTLGWLPALSRIGQR